MYADGMSTVEIARISLLRMLKNRAYIGDLVQETYECEKIRSDKRVTDPSKWIVTENHHDPFAVMKLTSELMDEYVEWVEIHPDNEIKVIWK